MNVNYLRLPQLPSFDQYGQIFKSIEKGDGFITTGEILLPSTSIAPDGVQRIRVNARISSTFPLRMAELVWGDGAQTHHQIVDLDSTPPFDDISTPGCSTPPTGHGRGLRCGMWRAMAPSPSRSGAIKPGRRLIKALSAPTVHSDRLSTVERIEALKLRDSDKSKESGLFMSFRFR